MGSRGRLAGGDSAYPEDTVGSFELKLSPKFLVEATLRSPLNSKKANEKETATAVYGRVQGTGSSAGKAWSDGTGDRAETGNQHQTVRNRVKAAAPGKPGRRRKPQHQEKAPSLRHQLQGGRPSVARFRSRHAKPVSAGHDRRAWPFRSALTLLARRYAKRHCQPAIMTDRVRQMLTSQATTVSQAAWWRKDCTTFSDAIALVRQWLWHADHEVSFKKHRT